MKIVSSRWMNAIAILASTGPVVSTLSTIIIVHVSKDSQEEIAKSTSTIAR